MTVRIDCLIVSPGRIDAYIDGVKHTGTMHFHRSSTNPDVPQVVVDGVVLGDVDVFYWRNPVVAHSVRPETP